MPGYAHADLAWLYGMAGCFDFVRQSTSGASTMPAGSTRGLMAAQPGAMSVIPSGWTRSPATSSALPTELHWAVITWIQQNQGTVIPCFCSRAS